ncbi:uncharacterized protein METZ01_LOCUS365727, partial [marine metagenome]
ERLSVQVKVPPLSVAEEGVQDKETVGSVVVSVVVSLSTPDEVLEEQKGQQVNLSEQPLIPTATRNTPAIKIGKSLYFIVATRIQCSTVSGQLVTS